MRSILIILLVTVLAGCSSVGPALYNGRYYMIDRSVCVKWREYADNSMLCVDKEGNSIGYVNPMSDQQVQMYLGRRNEPMPTYNYYQPKRNYCSTLNGLTTCW